MSDALTPAAYLTKMADFAKKRAEASGYDAARFAADYKYVRIGGNGFRAISISPRQPCGKLGTATTVKGFKKALEHAENNELGESCVPGNKKREHRLQAHLIRRSIMRRSDVPWMLDIADLVDELWFVTDELSLRGLLAYGASQEILRMDMVYLGRKGDRYFPVFVELKVVRTLKKVREQLDAARDVASTHRAEFTSFIANASGVDLTAENFSVDDALRILVWPRMPSARSRDAASAHVDAAMTQDPTLVVVEFPPSELAELADNHDTVIGLSRYHRGAAKPVAQA